MGAEFFDTNILLYLVSNDQKKADRAESLLAVGGVISVQVLNELTNVARRKMHLSWEETHSLLSTVRELVAVKDVTLAVHEHGLALAERYGLSLYDAMIASAALGASCGILWSEDMHHGLLLEKRLRIVNPFVEAASP